ncbi:MAG: DUF1062 domain-containing protein [Lachnospiraceae bacterium]|nr:DUF1062 domain-containing protein [Lachnospiraceae bacterium]
MVIHNPFQLKIRPEKQIAEVLGFSRNQVKSLLEQGKIQWKAQLPQSISFCINTE